MQETEVVSSSRLSDIQEELRDLKLRVAAIEQRVGLVPVAEPGRPETPRRSPVAALSTSAGSLIFVLGRALLGLAGAYLLRGISESALIPPLVGVMTTVAYAGWWLYSVRGAALQSPIAANIHGITAAAIFYPMLWETTDRFHTLPSSASAALLALFGIAGFLIARPKDLNGIAWITTVSSVVTALALILATHDVIPFTAALLAITAALEWGAVTGHQTPARGFAAFAADLAVLLCVYDIARSRGLPETYVPYAPWQAMALAMVLLLVSLGGVTARTLFRGFTITAFEIMQSAIAVTLSIAGALRISAATGTSESPIGWIALAGGTGCYLVSFAYLDRRSGKDRNLYAYSTLAMVLVTVGSMVLMRSRALTLFWSAAAVASVWLGARTDRNTLRIHGLLYLLFAAVISAGIGHSLARILNSQVAPTASFGIQEGIALAAATGCYAVLRLRDRRRIRTWREGYAVLVSAGMIALPVLGLFAAFISNLTGAAFNLPLRTAILAVAAVLLEMFGKRWSRPELIWLMYPCMALAAYKLAARDFGEGSPVGLAVSLLFFGGALMLLPRLFGRGADR